MGRFLSSEDFRAQQAKEHLETLDDVIKSLSFVFQHQIKVIGCTDERGYNAEQHLAACIRELLAIRNSRERISGKAVDQTMRQHYERRLADHGGPEIDDYLDVDTYQEEG